MGSRLEALRRRRTRRFGCKIDLRFWSATLVVVNLLLIAFLLLDAPLGSYAAHNSNILRPLGETITDFGKSGWIIIVCLLLFFEALAAIKLAPNVKARYQAILVSHVAIYIFVAVAGSGLLANLLKRAIGRARPDLYEKWGTFSFHPFAGSASFESFPSGHSTTVAAFLTALALLAPPYRLLFLIMGLWLGFSRVIVDAHYPSDVIAGLAFGAWFSMALAIVFSRYGILFRQGPAGMPELKATKDFIRL